MAALRILLLTFISCPFEKLCLGLDYLLQGLHFPLLIENQMTSPGASLEKSVDQDFDGRYYLILYCCCGGYTVMCAHFTEDFMHFSPSPLPPRYQMKSLKVRYH